jgi:hypothetical protein
MKDINVLIKDKYGYGYACVSEVSQDQVERTCTSLEDCDHQVFLAMTYQKRIDLSVLLGSTDLETDEQILLELDSSSKLYVKDFDNLISALNYVQRFWFRDELVSLPDLRVYRDMIHAIEQNPDATQIFYIKGE